MWLGALAGEVWIKLGRAQVGQNTAFPAARPADDSGADEFSPTSSLLTPALSYRMNPHQGSGASLPARRMHLSRTKSTFLLLAAVTSLVAVSWYRGGADHGGAGPYAVENLRDDAVPSLQLPTNGPAPRIQQPDVVRDDFEGASDLYAYLQGLRAGEAAGDPQALWNATRVMDYCGAYASNPSGYANDSRAIRELEGAATAAMSATRDRVSQRCRRFVPNDGFSMGALRDKRIAAARAGSLSAEAALLSMGEPLSAGNEYAQDLVWRVRRSADPDAYLAISSAMGIAASGREAYFGIVSGSQYSELAWQLAACRLGADCSPGGALMTSYCANGGICSRNGAQDFHAFVLDAAVPRQGADTLNEMVDSLLSDTGVPK